MKNNTPKMFRYGNIVNRIYFALSIVFLVAGLIAIIVDAVQENGQPTIDSGSKLFGYGIHLLVATILCNIFVIKKAEKQVEENYHGSLAPYINAIVFGIISFNPFYVIAGIFGIILNAQNKNKPEQIEENKEEVKE